MSPSATGSPSATRISATMPAHGANSGISIFIDSRIISGSSAATRSPTATAIFHTAPAISLLTLVCATIEILPSTVSRAGYFRPGIKLKRSRAGNPGVCRNMQSTTEPITVTIAHRLGREEAKRRIANGLETVRTEVAPYVKRLDWRWTGDYRLEFDASAMLQRVAARIEIFDDCVRVELGLPRLLQLMAKTIAGHVERGATALLEGPKLGR